MSVNSAQYIGYLEYSGEAVKEGFLDARKAAQALLGFDEALRFFVGREDARLKELDYEIPVRIKKGSWQALIPDTIGDWILTGIGVGITAYIGTAARELAKTDFEGKGIGDVFRKALRGIEWVLRLAKHLEDMNVKSFVNLKWRKKNAEVGVPNKRGDYLFVPDKFCDAYVGCPPKLFSKMCQLIEAERRLRIAVFLRGRWHDVTLGKKEKSIFAEEEIDESQVLFPELKDGQAIEVEGVVTRGNENTNTLGVLYREHILNCHPRTGSVVRFKPGIFVKCKIRGSISRRDKFGEPTEVKPNIIVDEVRPVEVEDSPSGLFSGV